MNERQQETFFVEQIIGEAWDPDKQLMRAILAQAFIDVTRDPSRLRSAKRRAEEEFNKRTTEAWFEARVGSTATDFRIICDGAGFNHELVRHAYFRVKSGELPVSLIVSTIKGVATDEEAKEANEEKDSGVHESGKAAN